MRRNSRRGPLARPRAASFAKSSDRWQVRTGTRLTIWHFSRPVRNALPPTAVPIGERINVTAETESRVASNHITPRWDDNRGAMGRKVYLKGLLNKSAFGVTEVEQCS